MTREEAKQNTWRAHCNFDDPRKAIHIVIDQIFDEHDLEMKAKDEEIERLNCRAYHAEGYISDLHNHPKDKKFYDAKARSVVLP